MSKHLVVTLGYAANGSRAIALMGLRFGGVAMLIAGCAWLSGAGFMVNGAKLLNEVEASDE